MLAKKQKSIMYIYKDWLTAIDQSWDESKQVAQTTIV